MWRLEGEMQNPAEVHLGHLSPWQIWEAAQSGAGSSGSSHKGSSAEQDFILPKALLLEDSNSERTPCYPPRDFHCLQCPLRPQHHHLLVCAVAMKQCCYKTQLGSHLLFLSSYGAVKAAGMPRLCLVKDREGKGVEGERKNRGESLEEEVLPHGFAWHGQEVKAPSGEDPVSTWAFGLARRRREHCCHHVVPTNTRESPWQEGLVGWVEMGSWAGEAQQGSGLFLPSWGDVRGEGWKVPPL